MHMEDSLLCACKLGMNFQVETLIISAAQQHGRARPAVGRSAFSRGRGERCCKSLASGPRTLDLRVAQNLQMYLEEILIHIYVFLNVHICTKLVGIHKPCTNTYT